MQSNRDVFATTDSELGTTTVLSHKIDVGITRPIKSMPYRTSPDTRKKMKEHIQDMLDKHVPIVLVTKKDGLTRCDFRKLNALTIKNR